MRTSLSIVALAFALAPLAAQSQTKPTSGGPPPWAYGFPAPAGSGAAAPAPPAAQAAPAAAPDNSPQHLPGAAQSFTLAQIRDGFGPADWYPGDHPQMPDIVAHGRKPDIRACGLCHYPNGKGRPENAGVAGLPYAYFVQTMADFKNGNRHSSDSRKANTNQMILFAKTMTDDEIKAAAQYFSSMKWTPWIRVVETDTVPKTKTSVGMFLPAEGNQTEPIAGRLLEVPENPEATETLRDPRSGFIAYAPVGSVKKGEALVMSGGDGKTTQCGVCHGVDLQGLGPVPGIAGRSPSYLARQLYDMQSGARNGAWTELMKPVVSKLTADDIVAISAYLVSRFSSAPPAGAASSSAAPPSAPPAAAPTAKPSTPPSGGDNLVTTGKSLFQSYGCNECHGSAGEGTDDAPSLVATKKTPEQIATFLQKPSSDARVKGMPTIEAGSPDLAALVAYVTSLKH